MKDELTQDEAKVLYAALEHAENGYGFSDDWPEDVPYSPQMIKKMKMKLLKQADPNKWELYRSMIEVD